MKFSIRMNDYHPLSREFLILHFWKCLFSQTPSLIVKLENYLVTCASIILPNWSIFFLFNFFKFQSEFLFWFLISISIPILSSFIQSNSIQNLQSTIHNPHLFPFLFLLSYYLIPDGIQLIMSMTKSPPSWRKKLRFKLHDIWSFILSL